MSRDRGVELAMRDTRQRSMDIFFPTIATNALRDDPEPNEEASCDVPAPMAFGRVALCTEDSDGLVHAGVEKAIQGRQIAWIIYRDVRSSSQDCTFTAVENSGLC